MNWSIIGNRVRIGALLTLSMVVLLILVMSHATPAQSQQPATVLVSNLGQPVPTKYPSIVHSEIIKYSNIGGGHSFAQSFCTGSVAATLDKVRLYTISKEADRTTMFYEHDPAPVVTIRFTRPSGRPGAVLHTLTNPVIDGSIDTAEDFTSSGYELAANTTYSVVIHKPQATGHIGFASTFSPFEDTGTQLGWAIGDQYLHEGGLGWTDLGRTGYVMRMAVYSSGDLPSISTPAFVDTDCDGTAGSFEFSVEENAAENTVVGVAAAGDADGDSMTYSVSGTDAAKFNNVFNFNTSSGEITVKSGATLDYESSDKSYSITVSVTDGEDATGATESPATTDATTSVSIEVINIDEPGTVTLSTTAPRVGGELTASLSDPDDDVRIYTVQWSKSPTADGLFLDIPLNPRHMADPTYTPTAADQSNYLKVTMLYVEYSCREVSNFDDRCRREAEFTFDTLVANAEGLIVQSQRVNRPATGEPRIIGAPPPGYQWVGWLGIWVTRHTVQDPDGLHTGGVSFQWLRVDPETLAEEDIPYARGRTYVPTKADLGYGIKVRASFVDDLGNRESRTSQPIWAPRPPNNAATGSPVITGVVQVGQTLSADTSGISDTDVIVASTLAYQWIANDGTEDTDIQDATGATYTLGADDEGKTIKVKVSFTDELRYEESLTSAPTATVASQESLFTATTHDVPESHDGATEFVFELRFNEEPGSGFSYAKLRNNNAFTVTGGSVSNVRRLEAGKNTRWEITVLPSGNTAVSVSLPATTDCAAEGAVCNMRNMKLSSALEFTVPQNSAATGAPTIGGTAQVGESLTASTSDIADANGLANASFTYQWLADDADISGATGSSYTLVAADVGKAIKVTVSFTDDAGNEESVTSAATAAVALTAGSTDSLERSDQEVVQENSAATGAPTIGGTAQVGEILTASTSEISDANGLANASFTYQWLADDADISGATGSSYTLVAADVGKAIKVTVSFTDDAGNEESVTSSATAAVALTAGSTNSLERSDQEVVQENSAATGAPTIGGTAHVGEILTASTTDIADANGLANASFTYQWLADDADIDGATTSSYTLADAEVGKAIKVTVSFTDDAGNEESVTSSATAAVTQPPMTATIHDEPLSHDGIAAFTFELRFSETPASGFSYATVRDHAFTVTGGSVENVRRLEPGKNVKWEITVTPDSDADVTVTLNATTDCTAQGAICTADGGKLSSRVELTIALPPPPPLTASIHSAPESHDGSNDAFTFELRLSGEPTSELSYTTVHLHALTVTGGTVSKARRLAAPSNARWEVTVTPDSSGDVTIVLPITSDCTAQGAICYGDGGKLSNRLELTVSGPGG